jgi:hypothetical protein
MHTRKTHDQSMIEFLELRSLLAYNIPHFTTILGGEEHTWITAIADPSDAFKKLGL